MFLSHGGFAPLDARVWPRLISDVAPTPIAVIVVIAILLEGGAEWVEEKHGDQQGLLSGKAEHGGSICFRARVTAGHDQN